MKLRFPLYLRILGMFGLNILLLAGAFLVVFRVQFHLGLDSFLAGQANRRVQALSQVVIRELQQAPLDETDTVLERFEAAFHLDLYVFRDGQQMAGDPVTLPPQIERATRPLGMGRGRGAPGGPGMGLQRAPRFGQPPRQNAEPNPDLRPPPEEFVEPLEAMPPEFEPEPRTGGPGRTGYGGRDPAGSGVWDAPC